MKYDCPDVGQVTAMDTYNWLITMLCSATISLLQGANGDTVRCKWSNEDCVDSEECCSGECVKLHEGTNSRCSKSPLYYPCFYSYQCEEGLSCGNMYSCCSPFWGVCSGAHECCERGNTSESHVCRPEAGFTYNRCLPSGAVRLLPYSGVFRTMERCGQIFGRLDVLFVLICNFVFVR